jgi:hypothetical protein
MMPVLPLPSPLIQNCGVNVLPYIFCKRIFEHCML